MHPKPKLVKDQKPQSVEDSMRELSKAHVDGHISKSAFDMLWTGLELFRIQNR